MAIKTIKGNVESLSLIEKGKSGTCHIGGQEIKLHRDLADRLQVGENVIISGQVDDAGIKALAINNLSQTRVSSIDPANLVLAMGMSFLACLLFFILGMQNLMVGIISVAIMNFLLMLAGIIGVIISLSRLFTIGKAARQTRI